MPYATLGAYRLDDDVVKTKTRISKPFAQNKIEFINPFLIAQIIGYFVVPEHRRRSENLANYKRKNHVLRFREIP